MVTLCLVVGMNGFAIGQTLISFDLYDPLDFTYVEQPDLDPAFVHFTAYLDGDPVWGDESEAASGSLYWKYVPGNIVFDEWDVFIDPAPGWLEFPGELNPSNRRGNANAYFQWLIDDTR